MNEYDLTCFACRKKKGCVVLYFLLLIFFGGWGWEPEYREEGLLCFSKLIDVMSGIRQEPITAPE